MRPTFQTEGKIEELAWLPLAQGDWHSYVFPDTISLAATGQVQTGRILVQAFKYKGRTDVVTHQYLLAEGGPDITYKVDEPGFYILRVTGLAPQNAYRAVGEWVRNVEEEFDLELESSVPVDPAEKGAQLPHQTDHGSTT